MNDNNLDNNSFDAPYRATKNLNTAMEAPQFNVSDAYDVNIKNVNNNNFAVNNVSDNINSTNPSYSECNNMINSVSNTSMVNSYNDMNNSSMINTVNSANIANDSYNSSQDSNNSMNVGNSFVNTDTSLGSSSYDNTNIEDSTVTGSDVSYTPVGKTSYLPVGKTKKKPVQFTITPELKFLVIIVGILLIFVFVMPNLYDIIEKVKLVIMSR